MCCTLLKRIESLEPLECWENDSDQQTHHLFCNPDTMSSIRSSMHADSIAVFIVCVFTWNVSHTPSSRMSAIVPLMPSTPKNTFPLLCSAYT